MNPFAHVAVALILSFVVLPAQEGASADAPAERADLGPAIEKVKAGDFAAAEAILAGLQADHPKDVSLLLMRGEQLLQLERFTEARDVLTTAAELAPDRERIQFQLGSALVRLGEGDTALECFGRELANTEDPQIVRLSRLNRSMLLERKRRWKEAAAELEAVLGVEGSPVQVYGDLATLLLKSGDLDAARDALDRGRAAGFESALHYYSVGAHLYRAERYADAVPALETAIELDGSMARAQRSLAAALNKLDRPHEALPHLRRYLELEPDAEDAETVRAQIRRLSGGDAGTP